MWEDEGPWGKSRGRLGNPVGRDGSDRKLDGDSEDGRRWEVSDLRGRGSKTYLNSI